jgi:hypothetical protein
MTPKVGFFRSLFSRDIQGLVKQGLWPLLPVEFRWLRIYEIAFKY